MRTLNLVAAALTSSSALRQGVRGAAAPIRPARDVRAWASGGNGLGGDGLGGDGIVLMPAEGQYDSVVVFLHGLGDTAAGWAPVAEMFDMGSTKFILPTAPTRPITINGGMAMPGWFDIVGLDKSSPEDRDGLLESASRVRRLIDQELAAGVDPKKIAVGGFSQGGAVALTVALRSPAEIGACVACSSWLPLDAEYPDALGPHANTLPVLFCHGDADMVVQLPWGQASHAKVSELLDERQVEWREYLGMGHSASAEEISDVSTFLQASLGLDLP